VTPRSWCRIVLPMLLAAGLSLAPSGAAAQYPPRLCIGDTSPLDFGTLHVGTTWTLFLQVKNCSNELLEEVDYWVVGSDAFVAPPNELPMSGGQIRRPGVLFQPKAPGDYRATLVIQPVGTGQPHFEIPLHGIAIDPQISLSPGSVLVVMEDGQVERVDLTLANMGSSPLYWNAFSSIPEPGQPHRRLDGVTMLWRDDRPAGEGTDGFQEECRSLGAEIIPLGDHLSYAWLTAADVVLYTGGTLPWDRSDLDLLVRWIEDGGSLIYQAGENPRVLDSILEKLHRPERVGATSAVTMTSGKADHPLNDGVERLMISPHSVFTSVQPGFQPLWYVEDAPPRVTVGLLRAGEGRLFLSSGNILDDDESGYWVDYSPGPRVWHATDNLVFRPRVLDWMAAPPRFLRGPDHGTLGAAERATLTLQIDSSALPMGRGRFQLHVLSNDDPRQLDLPIDITILPAPRLRIDPDEGSFPGVPLGSTRWQNLRFVNDGVERLDFTLHPSPGSPLQFSTLDGSLDPGDSVVVAVGWTPQAAGGWVDSVRVETNAPGAREKELVFRGSAVDPPLISASPKDFSVGVASGQETFRELVLTNRGEGELSWSLDFLPTEPRAKKKFQRPRLADTSGFGPRPAEGDSSAAASYELLDLTGLRIWFADLALSYEYGYRGCAYNCRIYPLFQSAEARGATVLDGEHRDPTTVDIVVYPNFRFRWDEQFVHWLKNGGRLLVLPEYPVDSGDNDAQMQSGMLHALGLPVDWKVASGSPTEAWNLSPFPANDGVQRLLLKPEFALEAPPDAPIDPLLRSDDGRIYGFSATVGTGRIIALGASVVRDFWDRSEDNWLFANQLLDAMTWANWVRTQPSQGVLPPGSSQVVGLEFDGRGMPPGSFTGRLHLVHNAVNRDAMEIPVQLDVKPAPIVGMTPSTVDIPWLAAGEPLTIGATLENHGSAPARIVSVRTLRPELQVEQAPSIVQSGRWEPLTLQLTVPEPQVFETTVQIEIDDPFRPLLELPVRAVVSSPPVARVDTSEHIVHVDYGQEATFSFSIENTGDAPLAYLLTRRAPTYTVGQRGDLWGKRFVLNSHPPDNSLGAALVDTLRSEGVSVQFRSVAQIKQELINRTVDVLWVGNPWDGFWLDPDRLRILREWVRDGGALLMEELSAGSSNRSLRSVLGLPVDVSLQRYPAQKARIVSSHPILRGIDRVHVVGGYRLFNLTAPAEALTETSDGDVHIAVQDVGMGRVVFSGDHFLSQAAPDDSVQRALGLRIFDWLSDRSWVSASAAQDTVAPSQNEPIVVAFESRSLRPGVYRDTLLLRTNDPMLPLASIPFRVEVRAVPILQIAPTFLEFGSIQSGTEREMGLTITNRGVAPLRLTELRTDSPAFQLPVDSLVIEAGKSDTLAVFFRPMDAKSFNAHLSFATNDSLHPSASVGLSGCAKAVVFLDTTHVDLSALQGDSATTWVRLTSEAPGTVRWGLNPYSLHVAWLQIEPLNGILAQGETDSLRITARADLVPATGTYYATVEWSNPGCWWPGLSLPITFYVGTPPEQSADTIDFGTVTLQPGQSGLTRYQRLTLENLSTEPRTLLDAVIDTTAFGLSDTTLVIDPLSSRDLTVIFHPPGKGRWASNLVLRFDRGDTLQIVPVTGRADYASVFEYLGPGVLRFAAAPGHLARTTVSMTNPSLGDLELGFEAPPSPSWLQISADTTVVAPGDTFALTVTADGSLFDTPGGPFFSSFSIHSDDPAHPTISVTAILTVASVDATWMEIVPDRIPRDPQAPPVEFHLQLPADLADTVIDPRTVLLDDALAPVDSTDLRGDRNGDGIADLSFRFDATDILDRFPDGVHQVAVVGMVSPDLAFVATGLISVGAATGVPDGPGNRPPVTSFALRANQPNPFNGKTTIVFALPRAEFVRLKVYDLRGRCVRTLLSERLPAGEYRQAWDGRDQGGRPVASGVYFDRLEAGSFHATRRMVLRR